MDPVDDVVAVEVDLAAGGRIKLRGVVVGEDNAGRVFDRKILVVVLSGIDVVDFCGGVSVRDINDAGTAGRDIDAFGVVIVLS